MDFVILIDKYTPVSTYHAFVHKKEHYPKIYKIGLAVGFAIYFLQNNVLKIRIIMFASYNCHCFDLVIVFIHFYAHIHFCCLNYVQFWHINLALTTLFIV